MRKLKKSHLIIEIKQSRFIFQFCQKMNERRKQRHQPKDKRTKQQ
jgi:hypothetical protein